MIAIGLLRERGAPRWLMMCPLLAIMAGAPGCRATITPPRAVTDPVSVFVLDHGRTSSIVLPTSDGATVRYAYGDWRYYALRRDDALSGAAALLVPTRGALGRMRMSAPPTAEAMEGITWSLAEATFEIKVERAAAARLVDELDRLFDAAIATRIDTPSVNLEFVHHPRAYTYFDNSNHFVADALRAMGCAVEGPTYLSRWQISEGRPEHAPEEQMGALWCD